MNRTKIQDAILAEYRLHGPRNQEHILVESFKRIADMDLIVLAQEIGIDTDKVLEVARS